MANPSSPRRASSTASSPTCPAIMPPSVTSAAAMPAARSGPGGGPCCSATASSGANVNGVRYDRRRVAGVEGARPRLGAAVGHGRAGMLPHVLAPRLGDEGLDVAVRLARVPVQAPADAAVPPAQLADLFHGSGEGVGVVGRRPVLH